MSGPGQTLIRRDERRYGCPLAFTMGKSNDRHYRLARWSAAVHGGRGLRLGTIAARTLAVAADSLDPCCSMCGDTETVELHTERQTIAVCATCGDGDWDRRKAMIDEAQAADFAELVR